MKAFARAPITLASADRFEKRERIGRRDRCRQVSEPATSDALLPDHRVEGDQDDDAEEDGRRQNEGFLQNGDPPPAESVKSFLSP